MTQLYSLAFTFSPFARGQKESSTRRPRNYEFAHGTCRSAKIVQIYAQLVCSRDGVDIKIHALRHAFEILNSVTGRLIAYRFSRSPLLRYSMHPGFDGIFK